MGVPMFSAHLFCLYFGVLADVTPPVALATYAASGIAKSNPMKTGFTALATAAAGFLVPYMFVYNPYLLLKGDILHIILGCVTAILAVIALSAGIQGHFLSKLNIVERLAFIVLPFAIIYPSLLANLLAVTVIAIVFLLQKVRLKQYVV
jgi:TRAP-type uncharacterized transport system fused permease subunit